MNKLMYITPLMLTGMLLSTVYTIESANASDANERDGFTPKVVEVTYAQEAAPAETPDKAKGAEDEGMNWEEEF